MAQSFVVSSLMGGFLWLCVDSLEELPKLISGRRFSRLRIYRDTRSSVSYPVTRSWKPGKKFKLRFENGWVPPNYCHAIVNLPNPSPREAMG